MADLLLQVSEMSLRIPLQTGGIALDHFGAVRCCGGSDGDQSEL
jgi:hypothetical protein